jgi:hypothetical protein
MPVEKLCDVCGKALHKYAYKRRTCSPACGYEMRKRGGPDRFRAKVDSSGGPDACWPFMGARSSDGYGSVVFQGKLRGAHQVAYFLENGVWPKHTMHSCDNPPCCNPRHLFDGSVKQNQNDAVARGRQPSGERSPRAKLTDAQASSIRARYDGGECAGGIAKDFPQVSYQQVWRIATRGKGRV